MLTLIGAVHSNGGDCLLFSGSQTAALTMPKQEKSDWMCALSLQRRIMETFVPIWLSEFVDLINYPDTNTVNFTWNSQERTHRSNRHWMGWDGRTPHPPIHCSRPAAPQSTGSQDKLSVNQKLTPQTRVAVRTGADLEPKNQRGRLDVRRIVDGEDRPLDGDPRQRLLPAAASARVRQGTDGQPCGGRP
jgi:hypothetical protein